MHKAHTHEAEGHFTMRVFETTLHYNLVQLGEDIECETPKQVAEYMADAYAKNPMQESFWVILLNRKHKVMGRHMVTLGTTASCPVHPVDVFKPAILASAAAIIVSHCHPSGDPAPSSADLQVTRQLREAARILEVQLTDHVICGYPESDPARRGYYSFRECGLL